MYTKDDVGSIPGRRSMTDAERQAVADEWNRNAILPDVADIPITAADEDEIIRLRPANRPNPAEILAQQTRMRARGQA